MPSTNQKNVRMLVTDLPLNTPFPAGLVECACMDTFPHKSYTQLHSTILTLVFAVAQILALVW